MQIPNLPYSILGTAIENLGYQFLIHCATKYQMVQFYFFRIIVFVFLKKMEWIGTKEETNLKATIAIRIKLEM